MTLSNAAENVFLAATVLMLLGVNHERDGGTDNVDSNRENQPSVAFPLIRSMLSQ